MQYKKSLEATAFPVTLFEGCLSNKEIKGITSIEEIFQLIKNGGSSEFNELSKRLLELNKTDKTAYKALKEKKCPAFIIGQFSDRKNEACQHYVPLLGFDIDHAGEATPNLLKQLSQNKYVLAAFHSPSGEGLRFLVIGDHSKENHKAAYKSISDFFSCQLGIPTSQQVRTQLQADGMPLDKIRERIKSLVHIDTGTNNIARLWFYTHVGNDGFYYNPKASIFPFKEVVKDPVKPQSSPLTEIQKIEICKDKVSRQRIAPGRNNYVYSLACEMVKHGIAQGDILSECLKHEEGGFGKLEIEKTVQSAIKSKTVEYSEAQIYKYAQMIGIGKPLGHKKERPKQKPKKVKKETSIDPLNKPKFIRIKELLSNRYDFRFNSVSLEIEYSRKDKNQFEILNENDLICELYEAGFNGVETPLVALLRSSFVPDYDPFIEYFESLPTWKEGDKDYINELAEYVVAKDQDWFSSQFKKMIVRVVACSINEIPFNKQCLVFKGFQNDGKTSFVRFLCPPALRDYYSENYELHNKDGDRALCNNIIINLDELEQYRHSEVSKMKAAITRSRVKVRLQFDRKFTNIDRRDSFFATTNKDDFLTDSTGNVRWLVMEVKRQGIKHFNGGDKGYNQNINMDLVYSQAYTLLKSGFKFEMTREEINYSEKINSGFQFITIEQELIQEFYSPANEDDPGAVFVTSTDIMKSIEPEVKTTLSTRTIGRAMQVLGFEKVQKYFKEYGYQKKGYWVKLLR